MASDNNSRIRVNIHQDGNNPSERMYVMFNENNPDIDNILNQPVFNHNNGLSIIDEINNALSRVQDLELMGGLFGNMIGGYENVLNDIMEDRMIEVAMRDSLYHYNTQEKKPNIKLDINSQKSCVEHTSHACAICKDDFELDENITILECKHILHTNCIAEWVKYKSECPVCRGKIQTIDTSDNTN